MVRHVDFCALRQIHPIRDETFDSFRGGETPPPYLFHTFYSADPTKTYMIRVIITLFEKLNLTLVT